MGEDTIKVEKFSGKESHWFYWKVHFTAILQGKGLAYLLFQQVVIPRYDADLEIAETDSTELKLEKMKMKKVEN